MKISAVIPVYNGKKYLREAVMSILAQSKHPQELILIDDGSTDHSLEILQGLDFPFSIQIFHQKNAGQSSARNRGIQSAKGDFIALLDQDDLWYPYHLEELAKPFQTSDSSQLGWVYGNVDQIDEMGAIFKHRLLDFCNFNHPQSNLAEMISNDMHILPGATLIRKKTLLSVGMFDERLLGYEDDDLFLRLYAAGWKTQYLPQSLLQWRIHPGNSGVTTSLKSRRIYARKVAEQFSLPGHDLSAAEIIGMRFFNLMIAFYKQALHLNDFARCIALQDDLKRYFKLAYGPLKKWKYRVPLMKYPRLIKALMRLITILRM